MTNKETELNEIVNEIIPILNELKTDKSKISVLNEKGFTEVDKYGTNVICLCGGLNGCGKWEDYFEDISKIVKKINSSGYHTWTINLKNDCLDDIFYLKLGITRKKNE